LGEKKLKNLNKSLKKIEQKLNDSTKFHETKKIFKNPKNLKEINPNLRKIE
jgi:hypothetical protein